MNALSTTEYTRMRSTAAETFFDTCRIGTATAHVYGSADTNDVAPTYSDGIACGFRPAPVGEAIDGSDAPDFDAVLRLPLDTDVTNVDRVEVTHRHGEALADAQIFTVTGEPARGPSALVLKLKLVTGESSR